MDENSHQFNAKKQKVIDEEKDVVRDMNRLGNLPDDIVQRILSFLPTKDAVRTSLFSKRWRNQWIYNPNLEFVEGNPDKRELFVSFVNGVLDLHGSCDIRKFSLSCAVLNDEVKIFTWIFEALVRKVEFLKLHLYDFKEAGRDLPYCGFPCVTLTVMHLDFNGRTLEPFFDITFPSLKVLSLKRVSFPNDRAARNLFAGCVVLEELTMCDCDWKNVKAVFISSPVLRKLVVVDRKDGQNNYMEDEEDDANNEDDNGSDESDDDGNDLTDSNGCHIVIMGTSLESFSYSGELRNDYFLYDSSSLVEACIDVDGERQEREVVPIEVAYRAHKLVRAFSNVKSLTISVDTVEILDQAEELASHMPLFDNLTCLQSDPHATTSLYSSSLLKILQNSPYLTSLHFPGVPSIGNREREEWKLEQVPSCFSTHLKTIEIGDYCGGESKLDAVKMLLKYATVLQTFVIRVNCIRFGDETEEVEDKTEEVEEQLLTIPRGSNCNIDFL